MDADTLSDTEHDAHDAHWLRRQAAWRRMWFFTLTFASALVGCFLMFDIFHANGVSALQVLLLLMFFVLFTWISGAFWTSIAGFFVRLKGRDPAVLQPEQVASHVLRGRTAIVIPVYNEGAERVFAGVEAIWDSVQQQPAAQAQTFDFFVLSDTRRPEIAAAEEACWRSLVERVPHGDRIFYRRRAENIGRKAGNIAEFVRNWGGAYDYMLVLDADSVMSGQSVVSLAQLMEVHPETGVVQSLPLLMGQDTLFGRTLQFTVRMCGPMFGSGIAFWQLGESNYWGHNAIIRMKPFAEFCALPKLPGSPPFGGDIMSHDIVEAAFIRRAGYKVWLVPDVTGSWEEVPSNVVDFAARDRRWAQGNLQHVGVMPMRGLHWLSRIHLLTGVLSYVSSPLWLMVLIVSSIVTCMEAITGYRYFEPGGHSLFPSWPQYRDGEIAGLLAMTAAVLFVPKILGAILALKDRTLRAGFGGARKFLLGCVIEQALSMLMAPIMMLFHSEFVVRALMGRSVGWDAQPRGDRGVTWSEAFKRHRWHAATGIVWGTIILVIAPRFIWWMLPVIVGMLIAVPFTTLTSRSEIGLAMRKRGLLLTPEEASPPPELAAAAAARDRNEHRNEHREPPLLEHRPDLSPAMVPPRSPLTMLAATPSYMLALRMSRREIEETTAS
ncbi:MAG TPA: glucans biosynthesis glucosyltransferase MdoH [Steroidobacteraceae bacterium]|jgi:membrane glycosyltransferase|nr:glucans biosynthesis glucosyltransferase MdoH [Steroidobacteraceae bacterium]